MAGAAQRNRATHHPSGGYSRPYRGRPDGPDGCHPIRGAVEIERAVTAFARSGNGGLIVLSGNGSLAHRDLIIALAARERLPAVYSDRVFVAGGGLISYDTNRTEQYRRAAGYVDRILKGEKPADLPVQAPTKYELVINLKTAKALGL